MEDDNTQNVTIGFEDLKTKKKKTIMGEKRRRREKKREKKYLVQIINCDGDFHITDSDKQNGSSRGGNFIVN
jgi:hypothetical protein